MSTRSENGAKTKRPSARSARRPPAGKPLAREPEIAEAPSEPVSSEPVSSASKPKPARASARRGATPKRELTPKPAEAPPVEAPAPAKRASARRGQSEGEPSKKRRPSARRSVPPPGPPPAPEPAPRSAPQAAPQAAPIAPERVARETEPAPPDPIYELEEKFDRLITEADSIAGDPHARRRAAEALSELAARLGGYENEPPRAADTSLIGNARELLSTDYYARRWGRLAMRNRSEQVDDFGLDRTYEARVAPLFETLYRRWFRATVRGVSRVPSEGRAMIVANHGGALPWDGPMVRTALRLEHPARRDARWLAEDFVYHMPFLGASLARVGAVRACPENAERLLEQEQVLTVFPEGMKGLGKLYRERYQLQRFGRGGYVKLALRTGAPIVPAGIAGSDEVYPLLMKSSRLAKLAGLPFLPVTPTFPWLGPLGLVPLPSRWVIVFGEPIDFSHYGPEAAKDALLVNRLNDEVRARVQELVAEALGSRDSVF